MPSHFGPAAKGLISPPFGGRRSRDAQLFFVNRRPVDPPKRIAKLINATPAGLGLLGTCRYGKIWQVSGVRPGA